MAVTRTSFRKGDGRPRGGHTIGLSKDAPLLERIEHYSMPVTESGCWIWLGSITTNGYGQMTLGNKMVMAHRSSYELAKGPIPKGRQLDHLCRVKCCVNPDHLEAVTASQNKQRDWHARRTDGSKEV